MHFAVFAQRVVGLSQFMPSCITEAWWTELDGTAEITETRAPRLPVDGKDRNTVDNAQCALCTAFELRIFGYRRGELIR